MRRQKIDYARWKDEMPVWAFSYMVESRKNMLTAIRLLAGVVGGCSKHRSYRGRQAPHTDCARCWRIWRRLEGWQRLRRRI